MSKGRRWRLLRRAMRYDERMYEVTRGNKPILMGFRTRAVDRMRSAYPDWPFNSNGNVRGWLL